MKIERDGFRLAAAFGKSPPLFEQYLLNDDRVVKSGFTLVPARLQLM